MTSPMGHLMLNFMTVAGGTQQSGRPNRIKRKYPFSMPISGRQNNGKTFGELKNAMSVISEQIYQETKLRAFYRMPSGQTIYRMPRHSIECPSSQSFYRMPRLSIDFLDGWSFYRMPRQSKECQAI